MIEDIIERTVGEIRAEADIDFISLPYIAESLREDLDLTAQDIIRRHTVEVIRRMMERGIYPGDYTLDDLVSGRGFQFRPGTPDDLLSWIESEWIALGHTPTLEDPICWFALKPTKVA